MFHVVGYTRVIIPMGTGTRPNWSVSSTTCNTNRPIPQHLDSLKYVPVSPSLSALISGPQKPQPAIREKKKKKNPP